MVFKRPSLEAILVIIAKIVNPAALAEQQEVIANKKAAKEAAEAANEAQGGMAQRTGSILSRSGKGLS